MRGIKNIHRAIDSPIDDLITYRAMPTQSIDYIDPFLFLNHHGPQQYNPNNRGLPFGPHPHKGFETLTFIFKGDLVHWDTGGGKNKINEGGIQWMTAGKGLVHAEISSDDFKKNGGLVEIIQLWLNLPAKHKLTEPGYIGLQKDKIPVARLNNGNININVISGNFDSVTGPIKPLTDIEIASIEMKKGGVYNTSIDEAKNILLYIVNGKVEVNNKTATMHNLIEFNNDGKEIVIKAMEDSLLLLGYGTPFNEPILARGPFVMNNMGEIRQAYMDYQSGKMGRWEEF